MTDRPQGPADGDYDRLLEKRKRLAYLEDMESVLTWDELTIVPEGRSPARAEQKGALTTVMQDRRSDPEIGERIEGIDTERLTASQRANVREIRREYERETAVPSALSQRLSEAITEATEA